MKSVFVLFSVFFFFAGMHHLYEVFDPYLRPDYPLARHLFFVVLDCLLAYVMLVRQKIFLVLLVAVSIQQASEHTLPVLFSVVGDGEALFVDWLMTGLMPLILLVYYNDVKDRPYWLIRGTPANQSR